MPSCLVVQHVAPEGPFAIHRALDAARVDVDLCRVYAGDPLPVRLASEFGGVVVMGGPMSAARDEGFETRQHEMALLREAVELGLPTLGVCLGAQLLAGATGGRVVTGAAGPEIGWAPVRFTREAASDPLFAAVPDSLVVLHWHGETYELPVGAVHLAESARYRQQAFRVGPRAWGLQFHLEVDEVAVAQFLGAFGEDLPAAGTTPTIVSTGTPVALEALAPFRDEILARFATLVAGPSAPPDRESVEAFADPV
ncbi:MAG: type 1 glutamine amidotransferase [Acidimicrobiales bacterium]|nr:type 1 glutamine amidotransferase [Acidimicrobiales bacterium]